MCRIILLRQLGFRPTFQFELWLIKLTIDRQPLQSRPRVRSRFPCSRRTDSSGRTCCRVFAQTTPARSLVDHLENLAALVRPHARAQAVEGCCSRARTPPPACGTSSRSTPGRKKFPPTPRDTNVRDAPHENDGANQYPFAGSVHCVCVNSAPSSTPLCTSSRIFSSCGLELIAPISVFLSSGLPTRNVWMRSRSFLVTLE